MVPAAGYQRPGYPPPPSPDPHPVQQMNGAASDEEGGAPAAASNGAAAATAAESMVSRTETIHTTLIRDKNGLGFSIAGGRGVAPYDGPDAFSRARRDTTDVRTLHTHHKNSIGALTCAVIFAKKHASFMYSETPN